MTEAPQIERLLSDAMRIPIEQCVSAYLGRVWRVTQTRDMADWSSHPAAILSDGTASVFVKLYEGCFAQDQLDLELAGLRLLTERSGVLTPAVMGNLPVDGGALAVMEAMRAVKRARVQWRQIGQSLARIHSAKWDCCGLETHGYWGSFYQDNTPLADWPAFFWERRIVPRLRAAVDSGHLPRDVAARVEKLGAQLPQLCGPQVEPSLLHGDAQQNNFISTARGPVVTDPAVYYGHPEIDLAYVDFFAPVSEELFRGYRDLAPLDLGFEQRRDLWRIPGWLGMVQVVGPQHVVDLSAALGNYV